MSSGNSLILRTDAGVRIGTGHLMRCLALAQAWQDRGGQTLFITACESESLRQRLVQEGFGLIPVERVHPDPDDWKTTSAVLKAYPDAWVVLDGYHFDSSYQRQIKEAGHPLLVIDDTAHLAHYWADVILNQNINAETLQYNAEPSTQFLLGTRYVLLRREFRAWRDWKREIREVARRVLVTMGGSDPDNVTFKVIRTLTEVSVDNLDVMAVVGADNPHYEELHAAACASPHAIRLLRNAANMPELMAWADLAVSTAGSTCWELAYMGLPAALTTVADNQHGIAKELECHGVVTALSWFSSVSERSVCDVLRELIEDAERRCQMSLLGRKLVDGNGPSRVAGVLATLPPRVVPQ